MLTTLSKNYIAYQKFFVWFTKKFHFRHKGTQEKTFSQQKKNFHGERKILTANKTFSWRKKNSHGKRKILKVKEKFSQQKKNSHCERKFLITIKKFLQR